MYEWSMDFDTGHYRFSTGRQCDYDLAYLLSKKDPEISRLNLKISAQCDESHENYKTYIPAYCQSLKAMSLDALGKIPSIARFADPELVHPYPREFKQICAQCHDPNQSNQTLYGAPHIGFSDENNLLKDVSRLGRIDKILYRLSPIAGPQQMPPEFSHITLTDEQRKNITDYVKSLQK